MKLPSLVGVALGPAFELERYGVWAMAGYAEVEPALKDWKTFISGEGVGLDDKALLAVMLARRPSSSHPHRVSGHLFHRFGSLAAIAALWTLLGVAISAAAATTGTLLAVAFARESFLHALFLARLQIKGVPLDVFNDVFLQDFALEPFQRAF